ncbi:MAG: phospholipase D-like domain-containing protein [Pyrinomonadaceae bacterium]
MSILGTDAYRLDLAMAVAGAQTSLSLVSAYITVPGIAWILDRCDPPPESCRALARWNCSDLVLGASDLEVYEALRNRGWRFFVLPDLHAKVYLIDRQELFVGSANLTRLGLQLAPGGNREIGVKMAATAKDVEIIDTMFSESIEVTPDLYAEFQRIVNDLKESHGTQIDLQWPTSFSRRLNLRAPERLWVTELFWSESPQAFSVEDVGETTAAKTHDAMLLGIDPESPMVTDMIILRDRFLVSRAWKWLVNNLENAENNQLYFGELSATLHHAVLDDPKPYRQNIKSLVANLISWSEAFGQSLIAIDQPNYAQRLRLVRRA